MENSPLTQVMRRSKSFGVGGVEHDYHVKENPNTSAAAALQLEGSKTKLQGNSGPQPSPHGNGINASEAAVTVKTSSSSESNVSLRSEQHVSINNMPPRQNTTGRINFWMGLVGAVRQWPLDRVAGNPEMNRILIGVTTAALLALFQWSGAKTSLRNHERILFHISVVSDRLGCLCCLFSLLLSKLNRRWAMILQGFGLLAAIVGFLMLIGLSWR